MESKNKKLFVSLIDMTDEDFDSLKDDMNDWNFICTNKKIKVELDNDFCTVLVIGDAEQ